MASSRGLIIYRRDGAIDAIDSYSRRLSHELNAIGVGVDYVAEGIDSALSSRSEKPAWILLQYNPFAYGRGGVAPALFRQAHSLRRLGVPVAVMVHEAWIDISDARSMAISLWQRAQLANLLRGADAVMTSTQSLAEQLGRGAVHVPIGTNIPPVASTPVAARSRLGLTRPIVVTLFGRGNPSRALGYAEAAISAVAKTYGAASLSVANLGADAPRIQVPEGVEVRSPGAVAADELSLWLWAGDLMLLPFKDGISTRRGTLMAALAHRRAVLGLLGVNTEPILARTLQLTPVGELPRYAEMAVELVSDPARLRELGESGAELYREHFDWPVVADTVAGVVKMMNGSPKKRVTFVAHDIGGSGGMERHTERLIAGLLDSGHQVTVVARTCRIKPRPGLRIRRVPTPSRPFTLAYPSFFLVASVLAGRRQSSALHATGAILARRADVITVHYCHHATGARGAGTRASRPGLLYRLNQQVGVAMARGGERWCYRPGRVRALCAVSRGVAEELKLAFPACEQRVRAIPNGVDVSRFAPDPEARGALHDKLGLAPDARIALFVGGDWERKGLALAVGALSHAPGWDLAVAGSGDQEPLKAAAQRDGTLERLHFLDHVDEMPSVYASADAFVFPTSYEAFPLAVLEAAASALPILVTRVNGATELIRHDQNGWFIDRSAEDIAARLNDLVLEPERGREVAANARTAAEAYSWEAMADAYSALYAELTISRGDD